RAEDASRQFSGSDRQRSDRSDKACHEFVVVVLKHNQPREGTALLTLVTESRSDAADDSFIEVRIAVYDDAVLAAHLADDFLETGLVPTGRDVAGGFPNLQPDFPGAGEGDEIHLRLGHEMGAD